MNPHLSGFSPKELEAVEEFLLSSTAPLVREVGDNLALMGTGTFFNFEGQLWLVTASHVIPTQEHLKALAIPMKTKRQFLTLGNCTLYRPGNPNLDVAIVLIQDREYRELVPRNWRVLEHTNIAHFDPAASVYVVAGYPRETLAKNRLDWRRSFTQIYTNPYPGGVDDADHSMFRLTYAHSAKNRSGTVADTPNLEGVSGASVWAIRNPPNGLWAPENVLKVVAVQVSFKHSDFIGCEWWALVREVFRRWAAEEAAVLQESEQSKGSRAGASGD